MATDKRNSGDPREGDALRSNVAQEAGSVPVSFEQALQECLHDLWTSASRPTAAWNSTSFAHARSRHRLLKILTEQYFPERNPDRLYLPSPWHDGM